MDVSKRDEGKGGKKFFALKGATHLAAGDARHKTETRATNTWEEPRRSRAPVAYRAAAPEILHSHPGGIVPPPPPDRLAAATAAATAECVNVAVAYLVPTLLVVLDQRGQLLPGCPPALSQNRSSNFVRLRHRTGRLALTETDDEPRGLSFGLCQWQDQRRNRGVVPILVAPTLPSRCKRAAMLRRPTTLVTLNYRRSVAKILEKLGTERRRTCILLGDNGKKGDEVRFKTFRSIKSPLRIVH
ncbi:unnamed protein product [Ixodes pacificus]